MNVFIDARKDEDLVRALKLYLDADPGVDGLDRKPLLDAYHRLKDASEDVHVHCIGDPHVHCEETASTGSTETEGSSRTLTVDMNGKIVRSPDGFAWKNRDPNAINCYRRVVMEDDGSCGRCSGEIGVGHIARLRDGESARGAYLLCTACWQRNGRRHRAPKEQILASIMAGFGTSREIAADTGIPASTVRNHIPRLIRDGTVVRRGKWRSTKARFEAVKESS